MSQPRAHELGADNPKNACAEGIQQRRLQEKCKSHNTVGRCLEATVTKLRTEVRDGECNLYT